MKIKIDTFFTANFIENENMFDGSLVVMIDVLRASTTVCSALYNGAKEIIPVESIDKAAAIYNNLSKEIRFLGGERNCIKPSGFDAGNSPEEYTEEKIKNKTVILTTSNGSKTFMKAKQAKYRIVGSFVNLDALLDFIRQKNPDDFNNQMYFLCAGSNGRLSSEDLICAGCFIEALVWNFDDAELSDSSKTARDIFNLHKDVLVEYLKQCEHSRKLINEGLQSDIDICFTYNLYGIVPIIEGGSIKKY